MFIEGKETGESGLEQFLQTESKPDVVMDDKLATDSNTSGTKTEKSIEGQKLLSACSSRLTGESSEKSLKEESSNIVNKSNGRLWGVANENQLLTSRLSSGESCPMKLLMQQVSSQGKSTSQTPTEELVSRKDLKVNNRYLPQGHLIKNGRHSDMVNSGSDVTKGMDVTKNRAPVSDCPPTQWFRLLPREPCDSTTVTNCWMPKLNTSRRSLDGSSPRKPGRPPKTAKTSANEGCSTSSTIQTNVNILQAPIAAHAPYPLPSLPRPLTLDEVRHSVMESLRQDPAPIPKGLLDFFIAMQNWDKYTLPNTNY